ncbi:MAG TPA: hypothetical protein VHL50_02105, partial [Pyrinomonadaceae bacterium]|nr:hypothetical protein [Pyrinomonadaceae bacterium]
MYSRFYLSLILALTALTGAGFAQDASPTPTPSPAPSVEKQVEGKQAVPPDQLQGVPAIAPNYKSEDRSLPDLGRVGVDMTDQLSLTLNEAITMALENN